VPTKEKSIYKNTKNALIKTNPIMISITEFFKKLIAIIINTVKSLVEGGKKTNVRAKQKIEMIIIDLEKKQGNNKK